MLWGGVFAKAKRQLDGWILDENFLSSQNTENASCMVFIAWQWAKTKVTKEWLKTKHISSPAHSPLENLQRELRFLVSKWQSRNLKEAVTVKRSTSKSLLRWNPVTRQGTKWCFWGDQNTYFTLISLEVSKCKNSAGNNYSLPVSYTGPWSFPTVHLLYALKLSYFWLAS